MPYNTTNGIVYTQSITSELVVAGYTEDISSESTISSSINNFYVTSIEKDAFNSCTKITSITIPGTVKTIGETAFVGCTSLTSVTIQDGVTTIEKGAFVGCTSLKSITIPGSVTTIEDSVFGSCTSLESVTLQDGVTSIGDGAFGICTSLTSITIPGTVKTIGETVFIGCTSLTQFTVSTSNPNFYTDRGVLFSTKTSSLIQYPIGKHETSYTIPSNVTTIEKSAFQGCTNLTSVTIPSNVTTIGEFAFTDCPSITGFIVDNNPTFYNDGRGVLFSGTSISSSTLMKYPIGNTATTYTIPSNVTTIGEVAFDSCTSLTSVTIPYSVTSIGNQAFDSCTSLTSVTIQDGVTTIGYFAFQNCMSLKSITIPNSVTTIEYNAFQNCMSLTSITIPGGVKTIEHGAFSDCTSLTSVTIQDGVTTIEYSAFAMCTSLTSITIPKSVTTIGEFAFESCTKLAKYKFIGKHPTVYGSSAFDDGPPGKVYYYNTYTWPDTYGGLSTLGLPPTRPDPPTNVTAISSNTQATVYWIAPVDDGGESISKYTIYAITGSTISTGNDTSAKPLKFTLTGLNSGTVYNFKVVATNSKGNSEYSSVSNNITTRVADTNSKGNSEYPSVTTRVANSTSKKTKVKVNKNTINIIWLISLGCVILSLIIFIVYTYIKK